jgi:leucyl-tRNA synthetase
MSKSKKNTIDPEKMIAEYGADSVRFFILSDSPPEKDIQWSDSGMNSSFKYIQKFWLLNEKICLILKDKKVSSDEDIDLFVNQAIKKINFALEKFRYNVIIAIFHEIYSFFTKILEKNLNYSNLKENYKKILITMLPVIPHLANECLEKINERKDIEWPIVNNKFIKNDKSNVVIQVNGKKRAVVSVEKGLDEKRILEQVKHDKLIDKYIEGKNIFKTIYVQDKILNLIIK